MLELYLSMSTENEVIKLAPIDSRIIYSKNQDNAPDFITYIETV